MTKILLFVSTKALADELYERINQQYPGAIGVIHSNKDQNYRFNAVNKFQEGAIRMLIATDIIARGLDIEDVSHVINFDMPDEPQNYVHRIGRTGRADKKGEAISLVGDLDTLVLNEPETSLNESVYPALAALVAHAAKESQIIFVSHSKGLCDAISEACQIKTQELTMRFGDTRLRGQETSKTCIVFDDEDE